jgi:hypothetical protein
MISWADHTRFTFQWQRLLKVIQCESLQITVRLKDKKLLYGVCLVDLIVVWLSRHLRS